MIPRSPRKAHRPRARIGAIIGLATTALALMAASPARAADEQGWFIALDVALARASLDREWADHVDSSVSPVESTREVFDSAGDLAWRGSFGYGFGVERGFLRVSYWSYDTDDEDGGNLPGFVNPLVFGAGYYGDFYYLYDAAGVSTKATTRTEAVVVDLDFARSLKQGRRFRMNWLAGVRYAGFDEDLTFSGDDHTFFTVDQDKHLEADAFGLRAGAEVEYDFGRIFALSGGMALSVLQSSTDATAGQVIRDPNGLLLAAETRGVSNDASNGVILDASLQGLWRVGQVDLFVGLEVSDWRGLVRDPIPAENASDRDSISFSSIHAGLRYWFADRRVGVVPASP